MAFPSRGRWVPLTITSVRKPTLAAVARATSSSGSLMALPSPVLSRRRSAAMIASAAYSPQLMSQAGSTWLTGPCCPGAPVISGNPVAALTV
jgi:hypothetical protein